MNIDWWCWWMGMGYPVEMRERQPGVSAAPIPLGRFPHHNESLRPRKGEVEDGDE